MATLNTLVVRNSMEIRDGILRTIRNGLLARGITNPNTGPGSDWWLEAQAIADQLVVAEANALFQTDQVLPDTATGDALDRALELFGIPEPSASGSYGSVILTTSVTTTVLTDAELIDGAGLRYKVITGGIYSNEDRIPVTAISTGTATNQEAGAILRWVSTPPFADVKAVVAEGGLINGTDEEDEADARERLFVKLQSPPGSGNAAHVAEIARKASPAVQEAFVYPAAQGPSTVHVAVAARPTATNKSRVVSSTLMLSAVVPYITGNLPEGAAVKTTTVEDVNADVAFGIAIPASPASSPPGPGGGWSDSYPWPAPDASSTWRCTVTGVTSTAEITVDALTPPLVNVSRICWLSPVDWKLYDALVIGSSGSSGAYVITLDRPFKGITTGAYIWPKCDRAQAYVDAVLASFQRMGPGEKTSNASALIRSFRHPRSSAAWPMDLGAHLTGALSSLPEVGSAQFFHRTDGTTTLTGSSGTIQPPLPATLNDAPKIFIPRHIAFYRIP